MGLFKKKEVREEVKEESTAGVLLEAILRGVSVDRETALSIPVISGYVDLICNTFAMIPFKLYKETITDGKKTTEEVQDIRTKFINDDTTDTLDGFQFKKAICEDYLLGKGGYAYIGKNGNKFTGLFYVPDKEISFRKSTDVIRKSFDILVQDKTYKDYEFIKVLRNTKDGASGKGLTTEISKALETAYQRLKYELELTLTGGSRKGFIKSQKHLDTKAIKELKEGWEKYYSGNANTVILNDGLEFQEASNSSQQNEMDAKNRTFAEDMAIIFHIGATYEDTIKRAIMPIAMAFATALNKDLLLEKEKKSFYYAPDTKELYKGSMQERYNAYAVAIKNGFKTRNEIRYMEDDDAIEGLDMISLGLGDVLLDAKTGYIYTPNTNTMVKMGENPQENPTEEMVADEQDVGEQDGVDGLDDIDDTEIDDELDALIDEFAPEFKEEERAYASKYYDPVKAHQYYEEHKKLKGRKSTAGLNETGKATAKYVKQQLEEERKRAVETYKAEMNKKIADLREMLKGMSKEERKERKAEIYAQIKSLRQENKERKAQLKAEYDEKYLKELDKIKTDTNMQKESKKKTTESKKTSKKSVDALAKEVIQGKWGNGADRKKKLADAGYDYDEVQKKVNQLV